jgi:hypothetical protein
MKVIYLVSVCLAVFIKPIHSHLPLNSIFSTAAPIRQFSKTHVFRFLFISSQNRSSLILRFLTSAVKQRERSINLQVIYNTASNF